MFGEGFLAFLTAVLLEKRTSKI